MSKRCFIFGALPNKNLSLRPDKDDLVIAADRGVLEAKEHNIKPNLIVGDFDSLGYVPDDSNVIRLPVSKDETDVGYAINYAKARGCTEIILYGVLGDRLDHTLANFQLANGVAGWGGVCYLFGDDMNAVAFRNATIEFEQGFGVFSVMSLSEVSRMVTIKGALYPLDNAVLTNRMPLGVSNEFAEGRAAVSVEDGTLIVMWQKATAPIITGVKTSF